MAAITRVDASCDQRPHPIVGDEDDGEMEFFIDLAGWIHCEAKDPERGTSGDSYGEEVIFEALSASSDVLGSTSMGYSPAPGWTILHLSMRMDPNQLPRVDRVVARWDRVRNTK